MLNYLYKRYKLPIYMTENVSAMCCVGVVSYPFTALTKQGIAPKGEWDLPVEKAIRKSQCTTH